jgi:glycosyltransferase involved in cell wall biosynthesis
MTKISVAMATYNGARFIREQLDSLVSQTVLPMELIITDDGSTDETLSIIEDFARQCPFPLEIHRNDERLGYAANFMRCANLCRGDLIAFCDQDDIWLPSKLELCSIAMQDNEVHMVYHNALLFKEQRQVLKNLYPDSDFSSTTSLSKPFSFYALGFTILFRRSLLAFTDLWEHSIDYGDQTKRMTHDQWISFIANIVGPIMYLRDILAMYRRHDSNVSLNHVSHDGLLKPLFLNLLLSAARAENSYQLNSKIANLLVSSEKHNLGDLGDKLKIASERMRSLGRWAKIRTDLFSETNFLQRISKIKTLATERAYRSKAQGGLGLHILVKDITIGLIFGGSKLLAKP